MAKRNNRRNEMAKWRNGGNMLSIEIMAAYVAAMAA
jgi:hypothetical protein